MSVDKLYRLRDRLCSEVDELSDRTGQLSESDVHNIKMLTASIHYIDEICETEMNGYSGARGRGRNASRDSMGRYSSEGNYSGGRMYPPYMGYGYSFEGRDGGYSGGDDVEQRLETIERMLKNMQSNPNVR